MTIEPDELPKRFKGQDVGTIARTNGPACPHCQHTKAMTLDSRPVDGKIRRRKLCGGCGRRFSTLEMSQVDFASAMVDEISPRRLRKMIEELDATATSLDELRSVLTDVVAQHGD